MELAVQRLKNLLGEHQELRPLLRKAQALSALYRHFISVAPPSLAQSCQILGLEFGTLSVSAANAAIAAKLRQLAPELVVLLQDRGCEVSGIRVKVQVSFDSGRSPPPSRKLNKSARDALTGLSQTLDHSPLQQALEKLAKSGEK